MLLQNLQLGCNLFLIELYAPLSIGFVLYNVSDLMGHHFCKEEEWSWKFMDVVVHFGMKNSTPRPDFCDQRILAANVSMWENSWGFLSPSAITSTTSYAGGSNIFSLQAWERYQSWIALGKKAPELCSNRMRLDVSMWRSACQLSYFWLETLHIQARRHQQGPMYVSKLRDRSYGRNFVNYWNLLMWHCDVMRALLTRMHELSLLRTDSQFSAVK